MLRGRFAPTPSGLMHIGNAAVALLSWLQIRSQGGEFVLRIEDIDGPRSKPEYAARIPADLAWLGLDWDEGPDVGGPHGSYVQSERTSAYLQAIGKLKEDSCIYPCYCSRAELALVASAPHGLASEGPAYPGTCKRLSEAALAEKMLKKAPSLRFSVPDEPLVYEDGAAGYQYFPPGAGGDFIVQRADGIYAYQLAVVVDDATMGITDVLRGADLLDSTPRQIWLYRALGLSEPKFAHIPLLFGSDGNRLSKRYGSVSLVSMQEAGIRPETLIGILAYYYGLIDRPEAITARELLPAFSLALLPQEPIVLGETELKLLSIPL
jgi:glutamyl-tRNA synthetase